MRILHSISGEGRTIPTVCPGVCATPEPSYHVTSTFHLDMVAFCPSMMAPFRFSVLRELASRRHPPIPRMTWRCQWPARDSQFPVSSHLEIARVLLPPPFCLILEPGPPTQSHTSICSCTFAAPLQNVPSPHQFMLLIRRFLSCLPQTDMTSKSTNLTTHFGAHTRILVPAGPGGWPTSTREEMKPSPTEPAPTQR